MNIPDRRLTLAAGCGANYCILGEPTALDALETINRQVLERLLLA